ncbi:hypothetical protein QBC42DRAFT_258205 [Cladorrhinum samala]|uniref:LYC1 C-terminal domain-containing protein n=1 Tax=Cladorrhinum samala TaxID=585594 RepID=A0AAV9I1F6_9PEZI|nr:hypothetical protein QBC42DRAFT_258205 [Cladorrhinum samala]
MASSQGSPLPLSRLTTDDVIFTLATPHQRVLSWHLNGASWAPPMSIEEYLGREQALSETLLSREGGTRYYVLHPKGNPDLIVSGCEVTAKRALVADSNTGQGASGLEGAGGGVKEVNAYGIASVFTNPLCRGKGMAAYLLEKVKKEVVDDGEQMGCELGVLYSDIGRGYYTKLGWKDWRSPHLVFELDYSGHAGGGRDGTEEEEAGHIMDGVEYLDEEKEIERLCEVDVANLRRRFEEKLSKSGDLKGKKYVAFLPDWKQISWHFARDEYGAKVMKTGREIKHRGARSVSPTPGTGGNSWVLWDHDLRENKLKILRIVVDEDVKGEQEREVVARGLLLAALREGKDWGLKKVMVWTPSETVSRAAVGIWREMSERFDGGNMKVRLVLEEREDGSIPSLRWRGGESIENVVWEENEYYAWC